jgi:hypothetical protein
MEEDDLHLFGFQPCDIDSARRIFAISEVADLPDGDWFICAGEWGEGFWINYLEAEAAGIADYTYFIWNQDGDAWMLFGLEPPKLRQLSLF